jgi:hypothetical protein
MGLEGKKAMSHRLTDTEKWRRENFQLLPPEIKLAWYYVTENCDMAGVWIPNWSLMSFQIGMTVTEEAFMQHLAHKVERLPNGHLFIPSFVTYQYGDETGKLSRAAPVHRGVFRKLQENGLDPAPFFHPEHDSDEFQKGIDTHSEDIPNPTERVQVKVKVKEEDKIPRGGAGGDAPKRRAVKKWPPALEAAYAKYPRKEGKTRGMEILMRTLGPDDPPDLMRAVARYAEKVRVEKTEPRYVLHWKTFVGGWRDWLEPDAGTCETGAEPERDWKDVAKELIGEVRHG